jgi:ABC-2 type transport system permease protein
VTVLHDPGRPTASAEPAVAHARRAGFWSNLAVLAERAVRLMLRDPESIVPALIVPVFFYVVNIGALQDQVQRAFPGLDYKAFQVPVAIIFAVTGLSRAPNLVIDIKEGYFDRLTITPVRRSVLLLGLMVADVLLVIGLSIPVVILGLVTGVRFETGVAGMVVFVLISAAWGLAYTGFPYAIALKTGNPAAVNTSFVLFFPFAFLTTTFAPKEALTGWLAEIATYNPVTYLLDGLRSLVSSGWDLDALAKALAAIAGVAVVSQSLALAALRGRLRSGRR